MARPKRGDRVPPPSTEVEWDLRYATKEALAFPEMEKQFPGNCGEAKSRLKVAPTTRTDVQKKLRGSLGTRIIAGVEMDQWQYDIASGARLWYCVDPDKRVVWLTLAAMGHPKATVAKGKRAPRNR
jgi:hypothetical protein